MTPDELTADYLSERLGLPIVAVEHERVGSGQVGMNVRCRLTYAGGDPPEGAPATIVAKLPSPDEVSRATGVALRNYEREVRFYQDVAPTVAIRTPRCFHAEWDPQGGGFVLLLEDLAPAEQGDQVRGCTPAEAELAVEELVRLHAPRWEDPSLDDVEWLSRRGPGDAEMVQGMYLAVFDAWREAFGPRLTADQLGLAEVFGPRVAEWLAGLDGPRTVTHGDYRLDNMMFGGHEGGYPLAVVDWQTPGHGLGVADLAYFCGAGLLVDERRVHEEALVGAYHSGLVAEGVEGFSADECWLLYRRSAFGGVVMSVVASMIVGRTERGDEMFTAMASRHLQHALDLGSFDLLG